MKKYFYSLAYIILLGLPAVLLGFFVKDLLFPIPLLIVILICLFIGGIFDIWAVRQNTKDKFFIWEYNSESIIGIKVFGVPLEDYVLFLVLTPIFIIIIWEMVQKIFLTDSLLQAAFLLFGIIITVISYRLAYKIAKKSK
ncbi:hypothetical protein A2V49_01445 [candidate division WWE3 bacterium RBG_19FT_COMBO_34_6]|uniref:Lycopene cyclase domain-containing protein n=1 Tax=candidate division WWE3 bacterium RBG_19FT_COMBO_34_6 TaxID=1802612 RepID=A0A1F4UJX8_UNCKA|nr:MAG: hypothetical protein A2V49_01445 [candidate division WWE3 bacterium RBG_19FT_COMBO_34_6]